MNQITLIGFVAQEPEYDNDAQRCKLRIGTSRTFINKGGEEVHRTEWHNCLTWNKLAARTAATLKKGDQVILIAQIRTGTWETDHGEKRSATELHIGTIGKVI